MHDRRGLGKFIRVGASTGHEHRVTASRTAGTKLTAQLYIIVSNGPWQVVTACFTFNHKLCHTALNAQLIVSFTHNLPCIIGVNLRDGEHRRAVLHLFNLENSNIRWRNTLHWAVNQSFGTTARKRVWLSGRSVLPYTQFRPPCLPTRASHTISPASKRIRGLASILTQAACQSISLVLLSLSPSNLLPLTAHFFHTTQGPRWCSGQTTGLSPRRTGFDSQQGHGNHARRYHWSAGFLWCLPFPPPLHPHADPYSPHFTLNSSQDLDVKSHPNISTFSTSHHSPFGQNSHYHYDNIVACNQTIIVTLTSPVPTLQENSTCSPSITRTLANLSTNWGDSSSTTSSHSLSGMTVTVAVDITEPATFSALQV
ncbi:hypothetical protein PR048_003500 [Dryococelus australis]|uniref:Uncharacterized protein n=1 Tax=Dryococelus australis TaxID=614101 RepID=A0ABQ9IN88_9NEOP|nr:hypothetical protein PR048_003500 [Dryococelus australis]